tara:strand:+ start:2365 stop:2742 length:378 start_codon:yes stop_codon:yes gene_type:complete
MSWATCYSATNNNHYDKPALMSDSRYLTNWKSNCEVNNHLKHSANLVTNYDYRQYLIKNAPEIMNFNQKLSVMCTSNAVLGNQPEYMNNGSDLKKLYLSRKELQNRLVAPIMTQEEILKKQSCNK